MALPDAFPEAGQHPDAHMGSPHSSWGIQFKASLGLSKHAKTTCNSSFYFSLVFMHVESEDYLCQSSGPIHPLFDSLSLA